MVRRPERLGLSCSRILAVKYEADNDSGPAAVTRPGPGPPEVPDGHSAPYTHPSSLFAEAKFLPNAG